MAILIFIMPRNLITGCLVGMISPTFGPGPPTAWHHFLPKGVLAILIEQKTDNNALVLGRLARAFVGFALIQLGFCSLFSMHGHIVIQAATRRTGISCNTRSLRPPSIVVLSSPSSSGNRPGTIGATALRGCNPGRAATAIIGASGAASAGDC